MAGITTSFRQALTRALVVLISMHASLLPAADPPKQPSPTVGMERQISELVLPGTELEVKPLADRRAPLVVRITRSVRHGTAWRYDLSWYGLEPGEYDLRQELQRKDRSSTDDLPPLPVTVVAALPTAFTLPHELTVKPRTGIGGYRFTLYLLAAAWILGLIAILWFGRRRRTANDSALETRQLTLADQLRPLVARGIAGTITPTECATLERLLFNHWSQRLGLEQQVPSQVFPQLRNHPEAGPLLQQLEIWLHQPAGNRAVDARPADLESLLAPYLQSPSHAPTVERSLA